MGNKTIDVFDSIFIMGDLGLNYEGKILTLIFGSLIYSFTLFCNISLLVVIAMNRSLHEPMYVFLFNLVINDLIGCSAIIPRVLSDVQLEYRYTSFMACFIQAFCLHMYGGATLLILSVMAFDRYIAICHPLVYHSIMTTGTSISLVVTAWLIDFLLVATLFGLTLRHPFCNTVLVNYYCDNISLLRLTCVTDTTVNNIYGLFITGVFHGVGVLSVVFSYTWIIYVCFKNNEAGAKKKALHTCATHLLVFLIYEFSGIIIVLCYRIPQSPPLLQKLLGMTFVIFPPGLNPIIYGIKTKEIQIHLKKLVYRLVGRGVKTSPNV